VQALWAFFSHVLIPDETAASIGWAPSPFQYEVGVANLGIALGSFYAAFSNFQARAAIAIAAGCFLAGAGVGHIVEIIEDLNFAPGNAGPIMITDFLTPIVVLVLLLLSPSQSPSTPLMSEQLAKAREDFLRVAAGQLIRPDGLERDDALDQRIEGLVHDAHRAAPQLAPDLILPKFRKFRHQLFPSQPNAGRSAHRRLSACMRALPNGARGALMIGALRGSYREESARPPEAFLADCLRVQNAKRFAHVTYTSRRSPTRTSGQGAAPSCRDPRRPAAIR